MQVALAQLLSKMDQLFPGEIESFWPKTMWINESDVVYYLQGQIENNGICLQQQMRSNNDLGKVLTWMDTSSKTDPNCMFIVKPAEGTQGSGIFILRRWSELESTLPLLKRGAVVQKYVSNPYLDDGYKFDLRVYVLVTSVDPLRVHICREGLVR